MKYTWAAAVCALAAAGGILMAAATEETSPDLKKDEEAIRAVIQLYFDGIIKYDEEALRKAFHPKANVIGTTNEGAVEWEPFQEWVVYTGKAPTRPDATTPSSRSMSPAGGCRKNRPRRPAFITPTTVPLKIDGSGDRQQDLAPRETLFAGPVSPAAHFLWCWRPCPVY